MPSSSTADFCKELRDSREFTRKSLVQIARITRVREDFLQALESGQWHLIPDGYVRGYLTLYVTAVGMNREKVLRDYDRLVAESEASGRAYLDESSPLLRVPEKVGVTRAKIGSTWFITMSHDKRFGFLIALVALSGLVALLVFTAPGTPPLGRIASFSDELSEYRRRLLAPYREIPLRDLVESRGNAKRVMREVCIHAVMPGSVSFSRDDDPVDRAVVTPFDTMKIQYVSSVSILLSPALCAVIIGDDGRSVTWTRRTQDTAFFEIPGNPLLMPDKLVENTGKN